MWIATSVGFISIVADRNRPDYLLIRARTKQDLLEVFPGCKPIETPEADYRFRISKTRIECAEIMFNQIHDIEYDNFKDSVPKPMRSLSSFYHRVWNAGLDRQIDLYGYDNWWLDYRNKHESQFNADEWWAKVEAGDDDEEDYEGDVEYSTKDHQYFVDEKISSFYRVHKDTGVINYLPWPPPKGWEDLVQESSE